MSDCFYVLPSQILFASFFVPLGAFVISWDMVAMRQNGNAPSPLIMIPGDGGCQAFAEFHDVKSKPFPIWVDLRYLITPKTFGDYFK